MRKERFLALQSDKLTNLGGMLHFIRETKFHKLSDGKLQLECQRKIKATISCVV